MPEAADLLERIDWAGLYAEATSHLKALIRIDTQNPPGNETEAARYLAGVLEAEGLSPQIVEPKPGRGSVVCRIRGLGRGGLLLASHTDVAPADPRGWKHPPFAAEVADGCIWGRGAIDMKAMTVQMLAAVLLLRRLGVVPKHDLAFAAVADEERGGGLGMAWLARERPDLLEAAFALCEVGGFAFPVGNRWIYPVQVAEKGYAWVKVKARGEAGHGSLPRDENPVWTLADVVSRVAAHPLAHRTTHASRAFIEALSESQGLGRRLALEGLLHPATCPLALRTVPDEEVRRWLYAMLHDVATPTVISAGSPENPSVIPPEAYAILDCRYVPGATQDDLLAALKDRVGSHASLEVMASGEPLEFPTDTPLYEAIERTVLRCDPHGRASPYLMIGMTDAKHLAHLGIITYGFFPMKIPADLRVSSMVHGTDERIPIAGFQDGLRMFVELVLDFCLP